LDRRAYRNQNLGADSVCSQEDLALTQRPESDTLRLEHRLFRNPVAEESSCTLLLSRLHDRGVFGGSKETLGKFRDLYARTNSLEINSDLLPLRDRYERTALRMGHIERDRGLTL
jgi:hypothetical protein